MAPILHLNQPHRVGRTRTSTKLRRSRKRTILSLLFALPLTALLVVVSYYRQVQLASKLLGDADHSNQLKQAFPEDDACASLECHTGTCLVNRCICVDPSRSGSRCETPNPHYNPNSIACFKQNDDRCMNTETYGRLTVRSEQRIQTSRRCEVFWWEAAKGSIPNRNQEQLRAFDYFRALPMTTLGAVLEMGAGPYTKTRLILEQEPSRHVESITLVDPLIDEYLSNPNITTSFSHDAMCVGGKCTRVMLHSITAEAFHPPNDDQRYDTVILVNTLEHTENAVQILHNCWRLVKSGGILVFGEEYSTPFQLQAADPCHPIRIMRPLFDEYLDLYRERLLGPRTGMDLDGIAHQGVKQSLYAIVRK